MSELLQVRDLSVRFATPGGHIDAVKNLSFRMKPGSTVALVGESGSGKSTVSQAILRILPRNGEIAGGQIVFDDPRDKTGPVDLAA
ncbi:MAG: ATP-binding cassette domain-containing protein, partial [Alphaproteobacteria bacterium]|nr:ATP-binding cassette domain-containing protein [Alphaproteobacteria bacterium]